MRRARLCCHSRGRPDPAGEAAAESDLPELLLRLLGTEACRGGAGGGGGGCCGGDDCGGGTDRVGEGLGAVVAAAAVAGSDNRCIGGCCCCGGTCGIWRLSPSCGSRSLVVCVQLPAAASRRGQAMVPDRCGPGDAVGPADSIQATAATSNNAATSTSSMPRRERPRRPPPGCGGGSPPGDARPMMDGWVSQGWGGDRF